MLGRLSQSLHRVVSPEGYQRLWTSLAADAERIADQVLFRCPGCSYCLLYQTAFICPAKCTRGLRNGPCRASTPQRCGINPTRTCTWFRIFQQAERQGTLDRLLEVNPPVELRQAARTDERPATAHGLARRQGGRPRLSDAILNRRRFVADWETFHHRQRHQLEWWRGDSRYHPPAYSEPVSRLEARLREGCFVVSVEVAPPMEPSGQRIAQVAEYLEGYVDTLNFTDNPRGVARMSGLACALFSLANGLEPVLQIQTGQRGRYDIESEVVGAYVAGVRNILCLCDDAGRLGPGPRPPAAPSDLDPIQALWMLRRLRDEHVNVDGQPVEYQPEYFLGAIAAPYAALPRYEAIVTEKKINAGAQFLQTLPIFDLGRFIEWMEALDRRDLLGKAYLIASVAPFKSLYHARFMARQAPGCFIPPAVLSRLERSADPQEESVQIALEIIAELKDMQWIHGLHILAPEQEETATRLVEEGGLKDLPPRIRVVSGNGHDKPSLERSASPGLLHALGLPQPES